MFKWKPLNGGSSISEFIGLRNIKHFEIQNIIEDVNPYTCNSTSEDALYIFLYPLDVTDSKSVLKGPNYTPVLTTDIGNGLGP